jgi:glycosyltransferase involved in cell wall biosynthesis
MKIAIVVKSTGVEYDDRVRKTAIALSHEAKVKIFIVQDDNNAYVGKTTYGIEYETLKLWTRDKLPRAKFLFIKTLEFYYKLVGRLKEYDAIWYNEEKTFLFPLLASKNQVFVWDNHEIPMAFANGWKRLFFWIIEKKAKKMLHANPQRIEYLKEIGLIKYPDKHLFFHNYPDAAFVNSTETPPLLEDFKRWVGKNEYVYLQGLNLKGRKPYNTISSVLRMTTYKIVVIGNVDAEELSQLQKDYPEFNERVYLYGMVPQLSIPALLKHAVFSIVLYDVQKPNNKYCEANRMYQAMALGVPVIVGCNPSMKEVVAERCGIALKSDGSDFEELCSAINKLTSNIDFYKNNCQEHAGEYIWKDSFVDINWFN